MENSNRKLYIIIIILSVTILFLGGYGISKNISSTKDVPNKTNENEKGNQDKNSKEILNKFKFTDYCLDSTCQKELGQVIIANKELTFSVDLKDLNSQNINGTISLGTKKVDITTLNQTSTEKIDGFEIFNDYLIMYTSSIETTKSEDSGCEIRGYQIHILDSDLNEISGLSSYTKNNPYDDLKIENNYIYYYALKMDSNQYVLTYNKISFNDLLLKDYEKSEEISIEDSCYFII